MNTSRPLFEYDIEKIKKEVEKEIDDTVFKWLDTQQTKFDSYTKQDLLKPIMLCKIVPVARRSLGAENENFLQLRSYEAMALFLPDNASLDDVRQAVEILEEATRTSRQVMGSSNELTKRLEDGLAHARFKLSLLPLRA